MFTVGMLSTNCYVTSCKETRETVIIDPGFDNQLEAKVVITFINDNGLKPKFIINTHGHPDHTSGNEVLKKRFHVPLSIHENDACMLDETSKSAARFSGFDYFSLPADILLHDGDSVKFGKVTLKVMHTPGHTAGSILLLGEKEVFSGDTLFAGSIGRVDLPGGSERDMRLSLKKLMRLPDHYVVYPGHGPTTTMGEEKRVNPFLQLP
jgi:hydroxyacylglutathione hydrolase